MKLHMGSLTKWAENVYGKRLWKKEETWFLKLLRQKKKKERRKKNKSRGITHNPVPKSDFIVILRNWRVQNCNWRDSTKLYNYN